MKKLYYGLVCFLLLLQVVPSFLYLILNVSLTKRLTENDTVTTWYPSFEEPVFTTGMSYSNFWYSFVSTIKGRTQASMLFDSVDELNVFFFGQSYYQTLEDINMNDSSQSEAVLPIMHFIYFLPFFIFLHIFVSFFFWIMSKFDPY